MGECDSHASSLFCAAYSWQQFLLDQSVIFLVLLSMSIQLILVLGGTIRYRTARRSVNFIIWICYMGADYVATSALGTMIHSSGGANVYAIWACVLMVHLGGPDTITAYSVPDSSLWKRHCFGMLYQGLIAAYIVYESAVEGGGQIEWYLLGAASLIFVVGTTKYGERVWALWLASPSQIVSSVQPIHNYMKIEHALGLRIDEHIPDDEIADVDKFREIHENKVDMETIDYQYVVAGEECFHEDDDNGDWSESIVTIKDVWEHEGEVVTDNYILCVSHALFKMYKRRFAALRFHEATLEKTQRFFCAWCFNPIQVFNIVEIELKFVYDYLFSKSSGTAFSGWGVGMRVVNVSLLGLCWFLIVRGLRETEDVVHGQRIVTYILLCVALGLEVFQLGRIMISDWSMVWLVCADIRQSRKLSERWWCTHAATLIRCAAKVVGRLRKVVGGKYWHNQIPQLCLMESCFSAGRYSYPVMRRVLGVLPFSEFIQRAYIRAVTAWHIKSEFPDPHSKDGVLDFFKYRFVNDLKERKFGRKAREAMSAEKDVQERLSKEGVGAWEHRILAMHVATTICEKLEDESKIEDEAVKRDIRWSVTMSRYFAYLLASCPDILAVDAENANRVRKEVLWEIMGMVAEMGEHATLDHFCKNFRDFDWGGSPTLDLAKTIVIDSLEDSVENNWAEIWLTWLYSCGLYDKSEEHGKRVTLGGELVSLAWVLMGHLGRGEEWYSPTAMKRDPMLWD